jgi:hypothetical protein
MNMVGTDGNLAQDAALATASAHSLRQRAIHELRTFFLITLYFWVLFLTFDLYRWAAVQAHNISFEGQGFAIVKALVLAKVTLLVETLLARRKLHAMPMLYAALGHALLLALILVAFHVFEDVVRGMWHGGSFIGSLAPGRDHLTRLLAMAAIFFVTTIPFCAFQEFARLIGHAALLRAILSPRAGVVFHLVAEPQAAPLEGA